MMRIFLSTLVLFIAGQSYGNYPKDTGKYIRIGGINQWISIWSDRVDAPVLLFLHGGPGNPPVGPALDAIRSLSLWFTVIVWHQRNSGKTLAANTSTAPVHTERMIHDAEEVIQKLVDEYHQPKIFLMGHSWGGYLALSLAATRPHLVRMCFAVSPMIHQNKSERLALDSLLRWSDQRRPDAQEELAQVEIPFSSYRSLYLHRKWLAIHSGGSPADEHYVREWSGRWLALFTEASRMDLRKVYPRMECPVFFLIGRNDLQTHFILAQDYFRAIEAPAKELVWFMNSAHTPHRSEPVKFSETILRLSGLQH